MTTTMQSEPPAGTMIDRADVSGRRRGLMSSWRMLDAAGVHKKLDNRDHDDCGSALVIRVVKLGHGATVTASASEYYHTSRAIITNLNI
jgi:hypothetical protein